LFYWAGKKFFGRIKNKDGVEIKLKSYGKLFIGKSMDALAAFALGYALERRGSLESVPQYSEVLVYTSFAGQHNGAFGNSLYFLLQ